MPYKTILLPFVLMFVTYVPGQIVWPHTTAGKHAASFIEMLNSTGDDALKAFITGHMSPNPEITIEQRVERFRGTRQNLQGAVVQRILGSSASDIAFIVKKPNGEILRVRIDLEEGSDPRIAGIGVRQTDGDDEYTPPTQKVAENQLLPKIEEYLGKLFSDDQFSGAVLIAKGGAPVFSKAFGFADKEKQAANTIDTKFNIGSENKIFTMLAIGMLADEGKLSFDDLLGKHLPNYPNQDAAKKVTIKHLLTMTSGIGDFFGSEFERAPKEKIVGINDYLPFFASKPLEFEPGKGNRYSNGGYIVLGAIIEKVSGKSYYDFVRERIFKPLGMNDTDSYSTSENVKNMSKGYTFRTATGRAEKRASNIETRPARGSSAGGGYSTLGDMLKFVNGIESGKLPVPKSITTSPERMLGGMFKGGLGIAGGAPGINATLDSKVGEGYTVIVMSNYDPPSAETVSRQIRGWLGGN